MHICILYVSSVLGKLLQNVERYRLTVTSYSHQEVTSYLISYFLKIVTSYFTSYYKK